MGIQQVRGAVERNHSLAGSWPTLDDQQTGLRSANDLVLLALDRRNDVAEPPRPSGLERGDQGTVSLDPSARRLFVEPSEVTKELVIDVEELTTPRRKVTSTLESERISSGRAIEGFGCSGPPVDDDRVLGSIPHADPADVQRVAVPVVVIDPAKHQ